MDPLSTADSISTLSYLEYIRSIIDIEHSIFMNIANSVIIAINIYIYIHILIESC